MEPGLGAVTLGLFFSLGFLILQGKDLYPSAELELHASGPPNLAVCGQIVERWLWSRRGINCPCGLALGRQGWG